MRFRFRLIQTIALCVVTAVSVPACTQDGTVLKLGAGKIIRTEVFPPAGASPKRVLLVVSGSDGVRPWAIELARRAAEAGVLGVVPYYVEAHIVGHGVSDALRLRRDDGTRKAVEADLLAIMEQIADRFSVPRSAFYAYGFSLGGAFVRDMAARSQIQAGVVRSGAWIDDDNDAQRLRQAVSPNSSPVLILAGTSDPLIPIEDAKAVAAIFEAAGAQVEAHYFSGGNHRLKSYGGDVDRYVQVFFHKNGLREFDPAARPR